jgi:molybdate transport system regulatory protein
MPRLFNAMPNKRNISAAKLVRPRLRLQRGEDIALGPGKVDLLALVAETGSIREAAERMHMSYMRAWTLIRTMNRCFKEPLIDAERGGKQGGGARLTETGKQALALYQRMEQSCRNAIEGDWREAKKLLRP